MIVLEALPTTRPVDLLPEEVLMKTAVIQTAVQAPILPQTKMMTMTMEVVQ